ncbi:hypothetical protein H6G54_05280 [Anabaena cylindrica FACHB-243]|uniref:Uncharacterized protein n=1 Tax=Anabaena cylindrica (strain ATCC 27899 / PCC 7122) TaxID=272123 RepID=K9ZNM4_ANACC|nr:MULTISPECIES: hypothetical protein [Anabaena]AFZ60833.1 hypothetical protein Anacy_5521 [Anabaena cylindrica PCC 7122]MBD2417131.1 hypothetical protein [Anabaena cylindrica FACHB-243]MBY5307103.1 hypothetical protein [Anabaena sp. CCAP 1446/1C]MCM2406832.1 hypothetical protein [Anabaena sp. CCAP 1446/1C]BAY02074.1 hypothetical protein NIES19_13110 [Anabaena cylindrica PCC 7122]
MTPSVTDKSPISATGWRRHTDPPFLWIVLFISSVSLHLLIFWLLRSSNEFKPWIPQSSQAEIPVDLIDISPQVQSTTKPDSTPTTVTSKFSSLPQQSVTASLPKIAPTPNNPDDGVINPDFNLSQQGESKNTEVNNQSVTPTPNPTAQATPVETIPSPSPTASPTAQATPAETIPSPSPTTQATPTATPAETIPLNDLPWNRRQEVKLGQGTLLPNDFPSDSPTPTPEDSPTPNPEDSPTPTPEDSPTPTPEDSPTPTPEDSPTPNPEDSSTPRGGGAIANVAPILKDEVNELREQQQLRVDALPDVLAEYQGSRTKELEVSFLPGDSELKPANILASLVIDKNGNFEQAIVINIEPAILSSQKSIYEQALNDIFRQESFLAAYNLDGSKPDLSNLYVRIRIEPINSP